MTNSPWYEAVNYDAPLMQGDIIFDCPVVTWSDELAAVAGPRDPAQIRKLVESIAIDVVVMTQACDLEQNHVRNVVLCPHDALSVYKVEWEQAMLSRNQQPGRRAWTSHCDDIKSGYVWNMALLNSGSVAGIEMEVRVVDFHEIYTVPRAFLEGQIRLHPQPRLRLLPPYREHLSQAFARYFMRVGLPEAIPPVWK